MTEGSSLMFDSILCIMVLGKRAEAKVVIYDKYVYETNSEKNHKLHNYTKN